MNTVARLAAVALTVGLAVGGGPATATAQEPQLPPLVEVAPGAHADVEEVQRVVATVTADPRGWGVDLGRFTIRIVPAGTHGLAPDDGQPGLGGLAFPDQRTALISDRFWNKVPAYTARLGADLDQQRTWFINHEIGHLLGHDHNLTECAGGGPAPVMRTATYKVDGCAWNAWPTAAEAGR